MGYTTRAARLLYPRVDYIFVLLGVKPKGSRTKKLGFLFATHRSYREFIDHTLQSCLDTILAFAFIHLGAILEHQQEQMVNLLIALCIIRNKQIGMCPITLALLASL